MTGRSVYYRIRSDITLGVLIYLCYIITGYTFWAAIGVLWFAIFGMRHILLAAELFMKLRAIIAKALLSAQEKEQ